jgi:nucleoside-diphosphate-sugar epimerase
MIFLTGATGYVGSHLVARFLAQGKRVRCLVIPGDPLEPRPSPGLEVVRGDVADLSSFEAHGDGVTAIVHAAALMLPNPAERIRRVNVEGTRNVIDFARKWGVGRIVYLSAVSAVYREKNSYGLSKAEAERLVMESGLDYTILRPTMIYGVGGGLHFAKLVALLRKIPLVIPIVGSGGARLQPVWIGDVVAAIEAVLQEPRAVGRAYGVSGATVVRFDQLVDLILAESGQRKLKLRVPLGLCQMGARVLTAVLPAGFFSPEAILGLSQDADLDHRELSEECGWSPLALEVGLKRALGKA